MTKKKLPVRYTGQHFTMDIVLIKKAIKQAEITSNDTVLDIGAGKGFLTVHLLQNTNKVIAIENDKNLIRHLRGEFTNNENVQIFECDIRKFKIPKSHFKVVSNIPYGITSEIFKILMFENMENFICGAIILQLEPAQKLFSKVIYNPYTVFYLTFFDIKIIDEVSPDSFMPPPTVKSALLKITRNNITFNSILKFKYLSFISFLLQKPDLTIKTTLKKIFRKKQVSAISQKFDINLNCQIVRLSPYQWKNCFLEMLAVVPEKYHPSN